MQPVVALSAWLEQTETSGAVLGARVGCHRSVISRIRRGEARPSFDLARRIVMATDGAVRLADLGYPGVDSGAAA